jgi:hypothetical protein
MKIVMIKKVGIKAIVLVEWRVNARVPETRKMTEEA